MTALATLITSLRTLAGDTTTSNLKLTETPQEAPDGARTQFSLFERNIVTSSVYASYGSTFRTQTGFTADLVNGIVTFSVAPASGTELKFTYNYQYFTDSDMTEFLNDASNHLGNTDPTLVAGALQMALLQYALGYFWQRRASKYAEKYTSSASGVSAGVSDVTKNFLALANQAFKTADTFRLAYYQRQGGREAPASGTQTYRIDPWTPMR